MVDPNITFKNNLIWLVFILTNYVTIAAAKADVPVVLSTRLGRIRGLRHSVTHNNITSDVKVFKKIPFAKPPIGNLRFEEPVIFGKWNGTLDATTFGPSCIQEPNPIFDSFLPNTMQSEDCLFLNIYTPVDAGWDNKKSVMVWIHGGGYQVGQGMIYDGSPLAMIGDVIVVTLNYRLNSLGFFRTNDGLADGNFGLRDQTLAIEWVRNHIDTFGGNPKSITLFGESAGAFSVGLQAFFPENYGLFQRVIQQSGTGNTFHATSRKPYEASNALLKSLGCDLDTSSDQLTCMRSKSANDILNATLAWLAYKPGTLDLHMIIYWAPHLKFNPESSIKDKYSPSYQFYQSLDVIVGNMEAEGSLILDTHLGLGNFKLPFNLSDGISAKYFCKHVVSPFTGDYFSNKVAIGDSICAKYWNNGSLADQGREAVNFYGDIFYVTPAVESLNSHAENNNRTSSFQYLDIKRSFLSPQNTWFPMAGHGDDITYLFPIGQASQPGQSDAFSVMMMKYWSNFAKTGDVNGPGLPYWPRYDTTSKEYLQLDDTPLVKNNLYKDRVDFWTNILNSPQATPCTTLSCILG